jgi:predicted nucleic acid-binding Zn ribbon protein
VSTIEIWIQKHMLKKPQKSSGPARIGDLLGNFLKEKMPTSLDEESKIFSHWSAAVGSEIAKQANPLSFKNGILFVETKHSAWITELNTRRHTIQRKLNAAIGKDLIREIHFRRSKGAT